MPQSFSTLNIQGRQIVGGSRYLTYLSFQRSHFPLHCAPFSHFKVNKSLSFQSLQPRGFSVSVPQFKGRPNCQKPFQLVTYNKFQNKIDIMRQCFALNKVLSWKKAVKFAAHGDFQNKTEELMDEWWDEWILRYPQAHCGNSLFCWFILMRRSTPLLSCHFLKFYLKRGKWYGIKLSMRSLTMSLVVSWKRPTIYV